MRSSTKDQVQGQSRDQNRACPAIDAGMDDEMNKNTNRAWYWQMSFTVALIVILAGCSNRPLIVQAELSHYYQVERESVVIGIPEGTEPSVKFHVDWLGKGKSAGQGIGKKMDDWACDSWAEAGNTAMGIVALFCMIAAVPVGAIHGAIEGVPKEDLEPYLEDIRKYIGASTISTRLSEAVETYAVRQKVSVPIHGTETESGLTSGGQRLEVFIRDIIIRGTAKPELTYSVSVLARARLVEGRKVLHKFDLRHDSGPQTNFSTWQDNKFRFFSEYLDNAIATMAINIVDEALLIWYPTVVVPRADRYTGRRIKRKPTPLFVLAGKPAKNSSMFQTKWENGLAPLFSWEAFPRKWDSKSLSSGSRFEDVRYRFRLYEATDDPDIPLSFPGKLIYERAGLTEAQHQLEVTLPTCQNFLWTVRAEFVLNGRPRVTDWSGTYDSAEARFRPWRYRRDKIPWLFDGYSVDEPGYFYYKIRMPCFSELDMMEQSGNWIPAIPPTSELIKNSSSTQDSL